MFASAVMAALVACDRPDSAPAPVPARIEDCADAACQEAWLLARRDQPEAIRPALLAVPQPEARIALVQALLDAGVPIPADACATLPAGDAQRYCSRLNDRPHLYEAPRPAAEVSDRIGPATTELDSVPALESALADAAPVLGDCAASPDVRACLSEAAHQRAVNGELMDAGARCLGISGKQWRAECLFHAAEAGVRARGSGVYAEATELCVAAAPFRQHCHSHLVSALAEDTPLPSAPAAAWAETIADAERIGSAWEGRDPRLGALAVDRFWSEALHQSYIDAPATGLLAELPAAALPHLRAAIAWRLVETRSFASWPDWVAAAEAAVDAAPEPAAGAPPPRERFPHVRDLWGRDRGNDAEVPATFYMATARRALAASPGADLRICLLEALARDVDGFPFRVAADDADPLVRWTAERLGRVAP